MAALVRWGVLGVAKIATEKVIPAMQRGTACRIDAIASRDMRRAQGAANTLSIPRAYGSYDALLADPKIDAVYIPLPNHLHVPWAIRAAEAGKHVLCEKPIALMASEAERLIEARDRTGMKIQEAFMVHTHPQWLAALDLVRSGGLGELRAITGHFSYFNADPANVRNVAEFGGGGLMDIGCYLVHVARWITGREPSRVMGLVDRDPRFGVDRLTSMLLDFGSVHAIGTCGTQMVPYQRIEIMGTTGRLEIEIPFNPPPNRPSRLFVNDGAELGDRGRSEIDNPILDQYTIQGDVFSRAILEGTEQALPLEDSVANMHVLDALLRSGASGQWERPDEL